MQKVKNILLYTTLFILGSYFLFDGLAVAKGFLIPVSIAVLLSLLMLPLCRWLEGKGISRGWAVLVCDLCILLAIMGLFFLVSAQIKNIVDDWPQLKKQVQPKMERMQQFFEDKTGLDADPHIQSFMEQVPFSTQSVPEGETQAGDQAKSRDTENEVTTLAKSAIGLFGIFAATLLVLVYVFFFMYFRRKFRKFILMAVPASGREKAEDTLRKTSTVAMNYLVGKGVLIIFLAALYGIGLSIVGIEYALLISIIAALLSLIPYIGNVIGGGMAMLLGLVTGGGFEAAIGVLIVFSIIQFIESYILEPFVVGHKVDLNPAFTIIVVVLGGAVWGVAGMVVAIPYLAILKVVMDHIEPLKPYGYLIGEEEDEKNGGWLDKFENWFDKKVVSRFR